MNQILIKQSNISLINLLHSELPRDHLHAAIPQGIAAIASRRACSGGGAAGENKAACRGGI
jgi:hypothetical protein